MQIIGVELLSGDGLKALSSTLDVHYDFWAWVLSDEATDGYWMHDHSKLEPCRYWISISTDI